MSVETDPGFWKHISGWLWLILAPLIGLVWGLVNRRIDRAEAKAEAALPKADFERHVEKTREDMKELFARDDRLKDHVNARLETLRTDMHESLGRLRDTMQQGFNDVRRELQDVLKAVTRRRE